MGWVLHANWGGDISDSHVYCHDGVNSATEYGALIDGGFFIFNDTDAGGDTELGVMKILNGSNPSDHTATTEIEDYNFEIFRIRTMDIFEFPGSVQMSRLKYASSMLKEN